MDNYNFTINIHDMANPKIFSYINFDTDTIWLI